MLPWMLVPQIYSMAARPFDGRLSALDVTAEQARFLTVLSAATEPMPIDVLFRQMNRRSQAGTGIVESLEGHGWVRRVSDPRGWRGVGVELTASGRELAAKVAAISQELADMFFGPPLTPSDRRKLVAILEKIRAAAFALPDADLTGLWQD
jgi:DNA-binding MarR family transcriptional regulator